MKPSTFKKILASLAMILLFSTCLPRAGHSADWPWDDWYSWQADLEASGGVITYSIDRTGGFLHEYEDGVWLPTLGMEAGFSTLFPDWETIIREALDEWGEAIGVTFMEVEDNGVNSGSPGAQGAIRITSFIVPEPIQFSAYAYYPPGTGTTEDTGWEGSICGDVFYAANMPNWNRDYFVLTTIHELGHALGLAHPAAIYSPYPESVMSYAYDVMPHFTEYDRANIQAIYLPAEEESTLVAGGLAEGDWGSIALETAGTPGQITLTGTVTTQGDRTAGIKGTEGLLSDPEYVFQGWELTLSPDAEITTGGSFSSGIAAGSDNTISFGGSILTSGQFSDGIMVYGGDTRVSTSAGSHIETSGDMAAGLAFRIFDDTVSNRISLAGDILTRGWGSEGVYLYNQADTTLLLDGTITTLSDHSPGIYARESAMDISVNGSIATQGEASPGIRVTGESAVVDLGGSISTRGENSPGVTLETDQNRLVISGEIHAQASNAVELWSDSGDNRLFIHGNAVIEGDIYASGEAPEVVLGAVWASDTWTTDPESRSFIDGAFTGEAWTGRIAGGTCVLNGGSNSFSLFTVDPGATLMGSTAFDGDLENNGLISLGDANSPGSLHVSGNYTQQGRLAMEVGRTASDTLSVDGDIRFLSGADIDILPTEPLPSGSYALVAAGGSVTADTGMTLDALVTDTLILDYSLDLSDAGLGLSVDRQSYTSAALTFNQQETGRAMDSLVATATGDLARAMLELDTATNTATISTGLGQISPAAYGSLTEPVFTLGRQAVAFNQEAIEDKPRSGLERWQFSSRLMGVRSKQYPADSLPGYQWEAGGLGVGLDRKFSGVTAGVSLLVLKNDLDQLDGLFHAETDAALTSVFASTGWRQLIFDIQAGWGWFRNDTERQVVLETLRTTLEAEPGSDLFYAHLGCRRDISLARGAALLQIKAGLDAALLRQAAFTETGSTLGVRVEEEVTREVQAAVGAGISKKIPAGGRAVLVPSARVSWIRELKGPDRIWSASIEDVPFNVAGYDTGKDRIQVGLGMDLLLDKTSGISINVGKTFQKDVTLLEYALSYNRRF